MIRGLVRIVRWSMAGVLLLMVVPHAGAQTTMTSSEAQDIFAAGNAFYRAQNYEHAAMAYQELVDAGYDSAAVLYNLGTADARVGSQTLALAYLQQARKMAPRNMDIRANLAFVKADQAQAGQEPEADAASAESLWSRVYGWLTAEEWLMVLWCGLLICCVGVAMVCLLQSRRMTATGRAFMVVGGTVFVLMAIPTVAQIYATKIVKKSIAIKPTEMLSGPAPRFTRVSSLEEGESVRMLGHESGGYERVETTNGVVGYVHQSELAKI